MIYDPEDRVSTLIPGDVFLLGTPAVFYILLATQEQVEDTLGIANEVLVWSTNSKGIRLMDSTMRVMRIGEAKFAFDTPNNTGHSHDNTSR